MGPAIDFNNTEIAFSAKTNRELKWEYRLFRLMNRSGLTNFLSKLAQFSLKMRLPVKWAVKKTVYEQFCGGETLEETIPVLNKLQKLNVSAIIDYGVEGKETEEDFERTKNELIRIIRFAKERGNTPFISCKVTGITSFAILEKLNGKLPFSEEEIKEKEKLYARMHEIASAAAESGIGLFIDAEESWIQDAIDELTFVLMRKYNQQKAVVYSTPQLYRHDRLEFCRKSLDDSIANNYILGLKPVRGAYMEKERKRAEEFGYPSPIQEDKAATDRDYDRAVQFCIENHLRISLCVATHNEKSSRFAAELLDRFNISHNHPHIWFSQLYGMSDHITFNLAKAGYNTAKYLPYGPVRDVIPYLIRRAQENKSVGGQMSRELNLIYREMRRRGI